MRFRPKFCWKWSFFNQNQPLNRAEPFERILGALFIPQCPYKFSSFLDFRNASNKFRLFSPDFRLFRFFFPGSACFSTLGLPPKFANLSKILWKIWKFWKRISADQIHSGGEGNRLSGWRASDYSFPSTKRICGNPSFFAEISIIFSVHPGDPLEVEFLYQERVFVAGGVSGNER